MINSQKVQAVAAQHRWLYHYKHLFAPLVGAGSRFFANLETEMKGLVLEKRAIFEFQEIEEQPKLIKGGQMKDYQVRNTWSALYALFLDRCFSFTGYLSWLICITTVC